MSVALVTGGSGGIGRAVCIALAARGTAVAVHFHRDRGTADDLATRLGNVLTRVPKSAQAIIATIVRSIFAQPDAESVREHHGRIASNSRVASRRRLRSWTRPVPSRR